MKVLVTVNITKGFDTWVAMSKSITEEAAKNGIKMIWAAAKHRRLRKTFDGKEGREKYPRRWIILPPFY